MPDMDAVGWPAIRAEATQALTELATTVTSLLQLELDEKREEREIYRYLSSKDVKKYRAQLRRFLDLTEYLLSSNHEGWEDHDEFANLWGSLEGNLLYDLNAVFGAGEG